MENTPLGEALFKRRLEKKMTLALLSSVTGLHTTYLGRIERGERQPSAAALKKLAPALDMNEVELLKMAGYLSPDTVDDRIVRFKAELKDELRTTLTELMDRVDSL